MRKMTLNEVQDELYDALKYVDSICKQSKIEYFLAFGTMLGAVRHNDFVPWDNDIDLFMKRKDFERFRKIMLVEKNQKYTFQCLENDKKMPTPELLRVCINGTRGAWPQNIKKDDFNTALYMDIFPLDYSSNNGKFLKRKYKVINLIQMFLYTKTIGAKMGSSSLVKLFIHKFVINYVPCTLLGKFLLYVMKSNKDVDKSHLVSFGAPISFKRIYYNRKAFDKAVFRRFRDGEFPLPCGYDEVLKAEYGDDYMTPVQTKETVFDSYWLY